MNQNQIAGLFNKSTYAKRELKDTTRSDVLWNTACVEQARLCTTATDEDLQGMIDGLAGNPYGEAWKIYNEDQKRIRIERRTIAAKERWDRLPIRYRDWAGVQVAAALGKYKKSQIE